MTEQEAIDFCKNDPEAAAKIILMAEELKQVISFQEKRIKELESRLNMDSSNSSKPPSTDNKLTKDKNKNKKPNSKKKRGAQNGHKAKRLKMVATLDTVEALHPITCSCCNAPLKESDSIKIEKRQLFDIPDVKMQVTEYQAHTAECKECHTLNKAEFPNNVNATTQYGDKEPNLNN